MSPILDRTGEVGVLDCVVVGLGWWGQRIVEELRSSDLINVVAAVDPSPAARDWASTRIAATYSTLGEALGAGQVRGVIITSPHGEHAAQIAESLAAGMHVFCEKPFTSDATSAEEVLATADQANVIVGVGHERRFEPPIIEMRKRLAKGDFGQQLVFEATFSHDKFLQLPADNWRLSPQDAPVGPLSATGIHLMDLAIAVFGWPSEVWAHLNSEVPHLRNGAALAVGMAFESGGSALFSAILSTPFAMRLCLYGSHGWMEIRDRTHPEAPTGWDVITRWRGDDEPTGKFVPAAPAVRDNLEAWATAALGGRAYPVTPNEILANVCTFAAISEAALSGKTIKIRR